MNWLEKFRAEFVIRNQNAGNLLLRYTDAEKIEQFIQTAINDSLEECAKETEEKKMAYETHFGIGADSVAMAYNSAIEKAAQIIRSHQTAPIKKV